MADVEELRNQLQEERTRRETADAGAARIRTLVQQLQQQVQTLTVANEERIQREEAARQAVLNQQRQANEEAERRRQERERARLEVEAARERLRLAEAAVAQLEEPEQAPDRQALGPQQVRSVAVLQQQAGQGLVVQQQAIQNTQPMPVAGIGAAQPLSRQPALVDSAPAAVSTEAGGTACAAQSSSSEKLPITATMPLLPKFSGDNKEQSVKHWLTRVSKAAVVYQWTPEETLASAENALTGNAKGWIEVADVSSWDELRVAMQERYGRVLSPADVHSRLSSKVWKKDDPILSYFQSMEYLALQVKLPDKDLQFYVAQGVTQSSSTRMVLKNAGSRQDFVELLEDLEREIRRKAAAKGSNGDGESESVECKDTGPEVNVQRVRLKDGEDEFEEDASEEDYESQEESSGEDDEVEDGSSDEEESSIENAPANTA